jgi:F-type H+-transporting ATPase subunit b
MRKKLTGTGWWTFARSAVLGLAVLAMSVGGALASGGGGHSAGLPQLNPETFPTQLFWLALSFVTLYFLMFGVALPRIQETLDARDSRIAWDITKADELKNESNQIMAALEQQLAEARVHAQEIIAHTSGEGDAAAKLLMSKLEAELNARTRAAEERIVATKNAVLASLSQSAVELVGQVASRVAGVELEPATVKKAVEAAIKEQA